MVASVAGLVECDPELLKRCIKDNGDGTVTVRLFVREKVSNPAPRANPANEEEKIVTNNSELAAFEEEEIEQTQLVRKYIRVKKEIPRVMKGVDALSVGALWMQETARADARYLKVIFEKYATDHKQSVSGVNQNIGAMTAFKTNALVTAVPAEGKSVDVSV